MDKLDHHAIAVIGMSCRFPGLASSLEHYWRLLTSDQDAVAEIPASRMNIDQKYSETKQPGKMYTRHGAFLQQAIETMDAAFFNISAKEAILLDPQQRLLLEVAWEAIEHAHLAPEKIQGSDTGIFIGISGLDYTILSYESEEIRGNSAYAASGNAFSTASGRIAYYLDCHGPTISIDTACSSALVAMHYAVKSLQSGECQMAITGGVNLLLTPENFINFSQATMLSPDGRCKTFDHRADGYGRGEGCGIVVLKRLETALADNDRILAVIRSSAINQDGRSTGLTAPNGLAQEQLIRQTIQQAELQPEDIDYVEAHGTGTSLGDPIELHALNQVFGSEKRANPLIVGTAKTHIGHLEPAAGIAGLIKTILSLQHQQIPRMLHFQQLNPNIQIQDKTIQLATKPQPWPEQKSRKRRAGVSSFGFSGTNAHIILEEAPTAHRSHSPNLNTTENKLHLFVFSARSPEAREALRKIYIQYIQDTNHTLSDLAYSSAVSRKHFAYRASILASSKQALLEQLIQQNYIQGHVSSQSEKNISDLTDIETCAKFYAQQGSIDWHAYYATQSRSYQKVDLPHYPFQRQHYWVTAMKHASEKNDAVDSGVHPLLGQPIRLPDGSFLFQKKLNDSRLSYLWDHTIMETPIMPGASYMEILVAAGHHTFAALQHDPSQKTLQINDTRFYAPLILKNNVVLQSSVTLNKKAHTLHISIYSRSDELNNEEPTLHAQGSVSLSNTRITGFLSDKTQMDQSLSREIFYNRFNERGYQYKTNFRVINNVAYNTHEAVVSFAEQPIIPHTSYYLSPMLLDGALQALALPFLIDPATKNLMYLPIGAKKILYQGHAPGLTPITSIHVRWLWQDPSQSTGSMDIALYNDRQCSCLIEGIQAQSMESTRLKAHLDRLSGLNNSEKSIKDYYGLVWKNKESNEYTLENIPATLWLIGDISQAKALQQYNLSGIILLPDGRYHLLNTTNPTIRWKKTPSVEHALAHILALPELPPCVVLHWTHLANQERSDAPNQAAQVLMQALLKRVQSLFAKPALFKSFLLCSEGSHGEDLAQAGFSGFIRSLWLELGMQGISVSHLDLSPKEHASPWPYVLAELAHFPQLEREIYYASGKRYLSQLDSLRHKVFPEQPGAYTLVKGENGLLEDLHLKKNKGSERALMPHELRVRVKAVGLNFRDLLNVMNLYPGDAGPLGAEFSGVITEMGAAVQTTFALGESVFGVGSQLTEDIDQRAGALSSEMIIDARLALTPPRHLNHKECASLPIVFLTAYEALVKRAQLKKDEKVLIHTATGGVGSAAIQIAKAIGADIYATAGSERKRNYLKNLGITHIYDSRSLDFGQAILNDTENKGVDVVLNTLTGEGYIETTLKSCANHARFIEISKRHVWSLEDIHQQRHDVQYTILALDDMIRQDIEYVRKLWSEILTQFEKNKYHALPYQHYPLTEIKEAFQTMQRAEHIGKIVVTLVPEYLSNLEKKPGSFLITGGLRGIGFEIAQFLIDQNVDSLILVGRQAPSQAVETQLQRWQERGIKVLVLLHDIAHEASVVSIFEHIREQNILLRGIIHAAGVLQDGLIQKQSWEQYEAVLNPKLAVWYLHQYSQSLASTLEYFIVFSSIAGVLGNPGQSNYAAANTFMDALMIQRYNQGLPGKSLQWGPWADVGMAKDLAAYHESSGLIPLKTEQAIALLAQALHTPIPSVLLADVQWARIAQIHPKLNDFLSPILSTTTTTSIDTEAWLSELTQAPLDERQTMIEQRLLEFIADVSGTAIEMIESDMVFGDMGLDSIMLVELHNNLLSAFGNKMTLSPNIIFNYPNPRKLSQYLAELLDSSCVVEPA